MLGFQIVPDFARICWGHNFTLNGCNLNLSAIYERRPGELYIVEYINYIPNLADWVDGSTEHYPMGGGRPM